MELFSSVSPRYLPEAGQSTVLRLGISPLVIDAWLQPDADFAAFHDHKSLVLKSNPEQVCLTLPESEKVQTEFADYLLQHLIRYQSATYRFADQELLHAPTGLRWPTAVSALSDCSRWIQEDICLLEKQDDSYRMTAACVCSPSNWKLEDKIGQSLDFIHAPVPGYQAALSGRVNRLLAGIKTNKPLTRINWSLQPGNELLWRPDHLPSKSDTKLYWRIERQCLLRLPETGAIVFSIRIFIHGVHELIELPGFQDNLQAILSRLPKEQMAYKDLLEKKI